MGTDSPGRAYYEPPDEPEPPSLADWLKRNNAPECADCGGPAVPDMDCPVDMHGFARFLCARVVRLRKRRKYHLPRPSDCRPTWHNIRPLSLAEREED